jgi:hypothetical protein
MKKYLLIIPFLFPLTSFAYSFSFTPSSLSDSEVFTTEVTADFSYDVGTDMFVMYNPDGSYLSPFDDEIVPSPWIGGAQDYFGVEALGDYTVILQDSRVSCTTSYSDCLSDSGFIADLGVVLTVVAQSEQGSVLGAMITTAETGFQNTVGETPAGAVSWAGDNLILLFIGSGLAVLFNLRYWILALVIMATVLFFAYRAFRFFRL